MDETLSTLLRIVVALAIFVVAYVALATVLGGLGYLAGFGVGVPEAALLAAAAAIVTALALRRIRRPP